MNLKFQAKSNPKSPNFNNHQKNSSMLVLCPNSLCKEYHPRNELENHLNKSCVGVIVACCYQNLGCALRANRREMQAHEWQCPYRKKSPESSLTSITMSSTSSVFQTDATGGSSQDAVNHHQPNGHLSSQMEAAGSLCNNGLYTPLNHLDIESANEDFCITITNALRLEMGISFVGGFDTPLQCIVIQEIFRDGLIAQDGRLRPGDQFVKVNEYNFVRACHTECRDILNRICVSGDTIYLTVHRDIADRKIGAVLKEEILTFVLEKPPDKRIGLKVAGKTNKLGLYIQEVFPDTVASQDGRLKKDDRLLKINEDDFVFGTQKEALEAMQVAQGRITFVVSRLLRPATPDIIRTSTETPPSELLPPPLAASLSFPAALKTALSTFGYPSTVSSSAGGLFFSGSAAFKPAAYREEVITVEKQPGESLGMAVAGGVNSQRGDTPVYVTGVAPISLLRPRAAPSNGAGVPSNGVSKGDIVLAVNDSELLGLSHERAVDSLRLARDNCNKVTVRVLKVPNVAPSINSESFIPSWLYWLRLPSYCQIPRSIRLSRDLASGSLGFSIVGGNDLLAATPTPSAAVQIQSTSEADPRNSPPVDLRVQRELLYRPIMIKSIVYGSPAYKNGRIKCGDILISINDLPLINVCHSEAVALFKSTHSPLNLKVVSWPGTIV